MRQRQLSAGITELNAQLPQLYQQVSVRAVITRKEHQLHRLSISYTFRALSVHSNLALFEVSRMYRLMQLHFWILWNHVNFINKYIYVWMSSSLQFSTC